MRRSGETTVPRQEGALSLGLATVATRGSYHTNEVSAELQVPIISESMGLAFAKTVEFDGQYRRVDNSLLNQCIKMCRDEQKCVGFSYSAGQARCELKDGGKADLEYTQGKDPPLPNFVGVKLVD